MKIYYYISVAASALSLVLAIVLSAVGGMNSSLQAEVQKQQVELQKQQEEINKGSRSPSSKLGPNLLKDMANVSVKDENMKKLLAKNGYDIKVNATRFPAPGSPAPPPPAPAAEAPASACSPESRSSAPNNPTP